MGVHKPGKVVIGAYVDIKLRDYLDKLIEDRGFVSRSDAVRAVIGEHRTVFCKMIDRNPALTPLDIVVNDNHKVGGKK